MEKLRQIEKAIGISEMEETEEKLSCTSAFRRFINYVQDGERRPAVWEDPAWRRRLSFYQTAAFSCIEQAEKMGITPSKRT